MGYAYEGRKRLTCSSLSLSSQFSTRRYISTVLAGQAFIILRTSSLESWKG
jgi:hypothetical protein